jgi:hypothetical protein
MPDHPPSTIGSAREPPTAASSKPARLDQSRAQMAGRWRFVDQRNTSASGRSRGVQACQVDLRPPSNGWWVILGTTLPGRLALQCILKVPLPAFRSFASGSIRTGWGDFVQETSGFRSRAWCPMIEVRFGRTMACPCKAGRSSRRFVLGVERCEDHGQPLLSEGGT